MNRSHLQRGAGGRQQRGDVVKPSGGRHRGLVGLDLEVREEEEDDDDESANEAKPTVSK